MAHQRGQSANAPGGAHPVSLKVLRLSRPSLATQTPLPPSNIGHGLDIPQQASLARPSGHADSAFPLTPLLTLPAAFGAAYVGETFACTLCANNEVRGDASRKITGVRIAAELQTPSNQAGVSLELSSADAESGDGEVQPGATIQRTIHHDLKDEGPHVLAVTVSYTETIHDSIGGASGGRARTFRKLYQFVAQQLVAVRSKVTPLKNREKDAKQKWVLEAQLENVGEASVVVEKVWLKETEGLGSRAVSGGEGSGGVVLKPQDVEQVMFVIEEDGKQAGDEDESGRRTLAQLNIDWRSAMGRERELDHRMVSHQQSLNLGSLGYPTELPTSLSPDDSRHT